MGSFIIPDNFPTRDEYTITADIVLGDSTSTVTDVFFVVPRNNDHTNLQPIAITDENPLIPILNGSSITLNATKSYDPDGLYSELSFLWTIIGSVTNNFQLENIDTAILGFFDNDTIDTPLFTVNSTLTNSTIIFELIVTDRNGWDSEPDEIEIKTWMNQTEP